MARSFFGALLLLVAASLLLSPALALVVTSKVALTDSSWNLTSTDGKALVLLGANIDTYLSGLVTSPSDGVSVRKGLFWRTFVLEREPGSGSIQFSAYGCIAPTRRLTCVSSMACIYVYMYAYARWLRVYITCL